MGTEGALPAAVLERYKIPQGTEDGFGKEGEKWIPACFALKSRCVSCHIFIYEMERSKQIPQPGLRACGSC